MDGTVYFATESPVWGGGRAFYDKHLPGTTFARAYLITEQQFADVYNQEMYRPPGTDLDLSEVLKNGRDELGNGRYETLIHLDDHYGSDGHPMLTFTAPWSYGHEPLVAPSGPYLRLLGHGLLSTHGWPLRQTADYLASLPGAAEIWSPDEIIPMLYPYLVLNCAVTTDDPTPPLNDSCQPTTTQQRWVKHAIQSTYTRYCVNSPKNAKSDDSHSTATSPHTHTYSPTNSSTNSNW